MMIGPSLVATGVGQPAVCRLGGGGSLARFALPGCAPARRRSGQTLFVINVLRFSFGNSVAFSKENGLLFF
jgi:hypothetical protein